MSRIRIQRQSGTQMIMSGEPFNALKLCKNILLAVLFGSSGNPYTVSTLSDMCTYTYSALQKLVGQNKVKKIRQQRMPRDKEILPSVILGTHAIGS
jgi:hypothetical protein